MNEFKEQKAYKTRDKTMDEFFFAHQLVIITLVGYKYGGMKEMYINLILNFPIQSPCHKTNCRAPQRKDGKV